MIGLDRHRGHRPLHPSGRHRRGGGAGGDDGI